jgi:hypothetical protein
VRFVKLLCSTGHLHIILEHEAEVQISRHPVHLALERVAGIAKTKWHPSILKEAKRGSCGSFANVSRIHRDLMIPFPEICLAKIMAASSFLCKVHHIG